MKLTYTTKNNRIKVELENNSLKEIFKQLAEFQEIFDEPKCGSCNSENIHFLVRTVDCNDYYELKCRDCLAKLAYGQHKTGGSLFPKRKLTNGNYDKENKGWHRWSP